MHFIELVKSGKSTSFYSVQVFLKSPKGSTKKIELIYSLSSQALHRTFDKLQNNKKEFIMNTLAKVLLSLLLSIGLLQAAAFEKDAKSKTTKVHLSSDKPLTVGSNTLALTISKDGKNPTAARVSVKAFMPAMPGMPAMESVSEAKDLGNGKYEVTINLAMGGTWQLHIFVTPTTGKKIRIKTSINL